jgi:16S rRNA processing protein RimM
MPQPLSQNPTELNPVRLDGEADAEVSEWLEIGTLVAPQGLNGELRVYPNSDFPERFLEPGPRWLQSALGQPPRPVELVSGRFIQGKGLYVVKLAGVTSRNQADELRGSLLLVPADQRLPLEPGEFHVGDLLGLAVYLQTTQTLVGTVTEVFSAGNDLLEVTLAAADPVTADSVAADPEPIAADPEVSGESGDSAATTSPHPNPQADPQADPQGKATRGEKTPKAKRSASKKPTSNKVLVPFVEAIVPVVDIAAGRIEITPPAGLLEG